MMTDEDLREQRRARKGQGSEVQELLSGRVEGAGGRAGLGLRVVAEMSLRRWVIWWLSESVKVQKSVGFLVCGGAAAGGFVARW